MRRTTGIGCAAIAWLGIVSTARAQAPPPDVPAADAPPAASPAVDADIAAAPPASAPATTTAPTTQAAVEALVAKARSQSDAGRDQEALSTLRDALAIAPNSVAVLGLTSNVYYKLHNDREALHYAVLAADAALDRGVVTTAEQILQMAEQLDPKDAGVLRSTARLREMMGRRYEAIEAYREYLKTSTGRTDARARLALGKLFLQENYFRQAISEIDRARPGLAGKDAADADATLASAYRVMRDGTKALECINRALAADATDVDYYNIQASVLAEGQKMSESVAALRRGMDVARAALRDRPSDLTALQKMYRLLTTQQSIAQARLTQNPKDTAAAIELAQSIEDGAAVAMTIRLHDAVDVLQQVLVGAPNDVAVLEQLARVQYQAHMYTAAAATCRRILAPGVDPNNALARRLLAEIGPITTRPASP